MYTLIHFNDNGTYQVEPKQFMLVAEAVSFTSKTENQRKDYPIFLLFQNGRVCNTPGLYFNLIGKTIMEVQAEFKAAASVSNRFGTIEEELLRAFCEPTENEIEEQRVSDRIKELEFQIFETLEDTINLHTDLILRPEFVKSLIHSLYAMIQYDLTKYNEVAALVEQLQ